MISSGTASARPVSDGVLTCHARAISGWNSESSLCNAPMTSAAATVSPNDEKRPTNAAASAERTVTERIAAFKVTIGANRMAARADKKPAIRKLISSIRAGAQPAIAATRRSSETAEVARPNSVRL
jgi:hypothetical protein